MSRFSVSSLLSHADSVAQVGSAASALQLPLASAPTLALLFVASWIAASAGFKRSTF